MAGFWSLKKERATYLSEFYALFIPARETFRVHVEALEIEKEEAQCLEVQCLLALLTLLETQTQQKLANSILKTVSYLWTKLMPALSRRAKAILLASLALPSR
jgi:hypothetical protein